MPNGPVFCICRQYALPLPLRFMSGRFTVLSAGLDALPRIGAFFYRLRRQVLYIDRWFYPHLL